MAQPILWQLALLFGHLLKCFKEHRLLAKILARFFLEQALDEWVIRLALNIIGRIARIISGRCCSSQVTATKEG